MQRVVGELQARGSYDEALDGKYSLGYGCTEAREDDGVAREARAIGDTQRQRCEGARSTEVRLRAQLLKRLNPTVFLSAQIRLAGGVDAWGKAECFAKNGVAGVANVGATAAVRADSDIPHEDPVHGTTRRL